ncbi:MAG TPA: 3-dehydroquinate synthase [Candidatus Dormibacteraeota bacterium]
MNNIVLVGFMGSGKSTVGMALAQKLERPFVDLDGEIEAEAGRSISEIFAAEGETGFRQREGRGLARALRRDGAVIAAGGGAPLAEDNWRQMRAGNTVVALTAEPAELERRLEGSRGRPLLQPGTHAAIASLMPARTARYLEADLVVETDSHRPAELAERIAGSLPSAALRRVPVEVPGAAYEVVIGRSLSGLVESAARRFAGHGPILLVSDDRIFQAHGRPLVNRLTGIGVKAGVHLLPAGEPAKDLVVLAQIYHALAIEGVDRSGLIIALGGGTVGDVAGFAAATWMRGIRYLQVPTTLLAMVDSSIGGKTGINLPAGKNLVGAFHQPSGIFADLDSLFTLPDDDYRASIAEIIKAALVGDGAFVDWLQTNLSLLLERDPSALVEAVARAVAIKSRVVAADANETGQRAILNYGHTVGHALERALGFGAVRHGIAVAWGMEVAARMSTLIGRCPADVASVQHDLLRRAGLLATRPTVDRARLLDSLRHDKKAREGELRWVLLEDRGRAAFGLSVPAKLVNAALDEVLFQ